MKATRILKGTGVGIVYRIECECYVCRSNAWPGLLCEHIVSFVRAQPSYVRFVLARLENEAEEAA